ncbi:MAG: DUF805 domain-containing protein [Fibrobacteres bacterium]|jgi:uncharacterized membrane protein YhaH (DUF805 family)|nr:DUF805 domain-containing protein [Fibrobacterota bacterium]
MSWYIAVLKKYAVFSGRARRKEYWMFCLFSILFIIVAMLLDRVLGTSFKGMGYGWIYSIYALGVLIPSLAVSVRRLHDTGKSGWFIFINLIPLIGAIWVLIVLCSEGNAAGNKYGMNPKLAA